MILSFALAYSTNWRGCGTFRSWQAVHRVLSQISQADMRYPMMYIGLSRQRIELLRCTHFAPRQQLALPDHVHEFDAGERHGG